MEREACVCDHGFERSDLWAEIIIIIIIIIIESSEYFDFIEKNMKASRPSPSIPTPNQGRGNCQNVLVEDKNSSWHLDGLYSPVRK